MLDHLSEALEACRTAFPISLFVVVPVLLVVVSPIAVDAAHDFKVYRMQQYDMQGNSHGCRSALVNSESRTLQSSSMARKCVMILSSELTYSHYLEVLDRGPSAILVLMQGNMSNEQMQNFIDLEVELVQAHSNIPIYFSYEDEELKDIYSRVSHSTNLESGSALDALINSATSVGFQLVANTPQSKPLWDFGMVNIEGLLTGLGSIDQLPTIAFVAHYDSFGVAPYLSYGANSDASGVVTLLELARILGKFYSSKRTHPKFNVLFLLSGGGKYNYQGSRKWLEEGLDNTGGAVSEFPSSHLQLQTTKLVVCLESLATRDSNSLRMHVSKPPNKDTVAANLLSNINKFAKSIDPNMETSLVHKKIRLASDMLAWEHERYSIRRLHAVTLSALDAYDNPMRRSIMDTKENISIDVLTRNIGIIVEAVVQHMYNITESDQLELAGDDYSVHKDRVQSWMNFLTSQPRPAQAMNEHHPVVTALEGALHKHIKAPVYKSVFKADRRDAEFLFYDALDLTMSASIVRSAVFDLYVAFVVLAYVCTIYLLTLKFNGVLNAVKKLNSMQKVKVH